MVSFDAKLPMKIAAKRYNPNHCAATEQTIPQRQLAEASFLHLWTSCIANTLGRIKTAKIGTADKISRAGEQVTEEGCCETQLFCHGHFALKGLQAFSTVVAKRMA